MYGAILFASKYGSTREYARWIGDETGLPVHDIDGSSVDPDDFDFLIIGLPVIYHKLFGREWIQQYRDAILRKPTILFTVSGVPAGAKLDRWIADSLSPEVIDHVQHVALQGRQNPKDLTWFDRLMLIIGGLKNPDRKAGHEELHGFDYMDRNSLQPIIGLVDGLVGSEHKSTTSPAGVSASIDPTRKPVA